MIFLAFELLRSAYVPLLLDKKKKRKVKEQEFLEFNGNSSANLHDVLSKQSQQ